MICEKAYTRLEKNRAMMARGHTVTGVSQGAHGAVAGSDVCIIQVLNSKCL